MRLMAVIIVVCFFLPLNSSAAVMEVNESGVQSAPLEILKKTKDVLNTTASEYLYIYENSATAALEYARPGTLSINLYIMTGFGNTRTYLDTKGGNTIGGASCSIGTQDVIGSKLLYARGEYTVKAYEGTSSMTWNDSIEWGDINT